MEKAKVRKVPWLPDKYGCAAKVFKMRLPTLIVDLVIRGERMRVAATKNESAFYFSDMDSWEMCPYDAFHACFEKETGIELDAEAKDCIQGFLKQEFPKVRFDDWVYALHEQYVRNRLPYHYDKYRNEHYGTSRLSIPRKRKELMQIYNLKIVPDTVPDEFLEWVRCQLPQYALYRGKKTDKDVEIRCTGCGHKDHMPGRKIPKVNSEVTCPCCGRKLIVKRANYYHFDEKYVSIFQIDKENGLVERQYHAWSNTHNRWDNEIHVYEHARYFVRPEGETTFFVKNRVAEVDTNGWYDSTYYPTFQRVKTPVSEAFWPGNFQTEFKGSIWQYSAIGLYMQSGIQTDPMKYMEVYCTNPELEYLLKNRMFNLLKECMVRIPAQWNPLKIKHEGKPWERFGMTKEEFRLVKTHDLKTKDIDTMRQLHVKTYERYRSFMDWMNSNVHNKEWLQKVLISLYGGVFRTPEQMIRYFTVQSEKSGRSIGDIASDYGDYRSMAKSLGLPMDQPAVSMPKDFQKAHDHLVMISNQEEAKRRAEEYRKEAERFKPFNAVLDEIRDIYTYSDGEYCVVVPKDVPDMIEDAHTLQHCVAANKEEYLEKIRARLTYILFMRKSDSPDTPYYTLEVEAGSACIRQQRTVRNSRPLKEVFEAQFGKFLAKWQKHVMAHMPKEERKYWMRSNAERYADFAEYRRRHEKVRGTCEDGGKDLEAVLSDNYINDTEGMTEMERREDALLRSAFNINLIDAVPVTKEADAKTSVVA